MAAQRRGGVAGLFDVQPEPGQRFGDRPPNQRLVVHDQHAPWDFSHGGPEISQSGQRRMSSICAMNPGTTALVIE